MMISDDNVTINQDYQISSQTQLSTVDSDFKRDGYKISYWTSNADGTGTRYDVDSIVNAAQVSDDLDFYAQWEKIVEQLLMTSINGNTYNFGYDKLPVSNVLNYKGDNQKVMSPFSENSELSNPSNLLAVNDIGGGINTVECDSFSYNCQNLTAVYLQNVTVIEATSFSNCSNLQIVYCPNLSSLNSSAFSGCSNLSLLILSSYDGVCQNDYAFWGNYDYLTIYVKDEQYKNYITATNWDNISSHISSVTQPTVTFLSGDTYETMVKIEKLNYNTSAIPPEITREGYELTGWDGDYNDVTCDTSCYAQWRKSLVNQLYFEAQTNNSTIKLQYVAGTYKTSKDGINWDDYELGTLCTLTNVGDKIYFSARSTNDTCWNNNYNSKFSMSGKIAAEGNIQYLLDSTGEQLSVPEYCYGNMFYNCTSLTQAPELPATTLANNCYRGMFLNCTSLTQVPVLSATTLADYCCNSMFSNCTSLTQAPELPATTLADYCYYYMFRNCTSLTQVPVLSATTLADYCYNSMFYNCTSLTQAPVLPATTLANSCYNSMFYNCSHLSVTIDPTKQGAYQILSVGSTTASNWGNYMFTGTAGDFTGTPTTGTPYYCWGN